MREENLKIEKIQKSSKVALAITNIARIFCIAIAVMLMAGGCLMFGLRGELNEGFAAAIQSGNLNEEMLYGFEANMGLRLSEDGHIAETVGVYMFVWGIMLICLAVVMYFVGKVFKDMTESYSPFCPEIVKNLKIAFVLITVLSLRASLLIGCVIGFALWCVVHVFEYGCELQKQSDETL